MRLSKLVVTFGVAGVFAAGAVSPAAASALAAPATDSLDCVTNPVYDPKSGVFYDVVDCF
jgi:hypothetical protein